MLVNSSQDIVNVLDILGRIKELEHIDGIDNDITAEEAEHDSLEEERFELMVLRSVVDQVGYERCDGGVSLIRESFFVEYAQEYARDTGLISGDIFEWPLNYIDWTAATEDLKQSFTKIDWDGIVFYVNY
jgi:hypothetical protein